MKILIASDLHFTAGLAEEMRAMEGVLPPGEYDHMQDGRLYWHNQMLVEEMGHMLDALSRLAHQESPDLTVFLGDMVSTNWSANVAGLAARLESFPGPLEFVTGNHDIYLNAPECRVQDRVAPGSFEMGLRHREGKVVDLLFLDVFVRYSSGAYRKWLDPDADVAGLGYRPQDVDGALAMLAANPETLFLAFGHFPMCDPEERLRVVGRKVGRGTASAAPLAEALGQAGNLVGIVTGHQHFNHLQTCGHGFHWTLPSLVEYPCAAAILEIDGPSLSGHLVCPDPGLARRSLHSHNAIWTDGDEKEHAFSWDLETGSRH